LIVLDTCSAINCFTISTVWLEKLKKCCVDKKIIWTTTTNQELIGLSKSKNSLEKLIEKLNEAENVEDFDVDSLPISDYVIYLAYLLDISNNDTTLLFNQFPKGKISLEALQSSGKNRLSNADKELIALARLLNATLATDDTRMLKMLDTFYTTQSYICSPKIIQKIRNITTVQQLQNLCHPKKVWVYLNYYTNKTIVC